MNIRPLLAYMLLSSLLIGCGDPVSESSKENMDSGLPVIMDMTEAEADQEVTSGFGAACEEHDDCDSGFCVTGAEGKFCTRTCSETCPDGLTCSPVDQNQTPPLYLCLRDLDTLCQPCEADADCQSITQRNDLCLDYGDQGKFCGIDCRNLACPDGYECSMEPLPNGTRDSPMQARRCRV